MEISKENLFTKLYLWFYNIEDYDLPSNLCPYFWKLLFCVVFSPILIILTLPLGIFQTFNNSIFDKKRRRYDKDLSRTKDSFTSWFLLFALVCLVVSAINLFYKIEIFNGLFVFFGIIFWFIIGFILIAYFSSKIKFRKLKSSSNGTIVGNFISAKYNKYCPQIKWKNSK